MKWTFQCWPWLLVPKEVMGTGVDEDLTGPVSGVELCEPMGNNLQISRHWLKTGLRYRHRGKNLFRHSTPISSPAQTPAGRHPRKLELCRWAPQWCERCWFTAWFVRPFINPTVARAGLSPTRRRCACCFPVKRRRSRWTTRTRKAPMEATSEGPNWRSTWRPGPWGGEAPKFC